MNNCFTYAGIETNIRRHSPTKTVPIGGTAYTTFECPCGWSTSQQVAGMFEIGEMEQRERDTREELLFHANHCEEATPDEQD